MNNPLLSKFPFEISKIITLFYRNFINSQLYLSLNNVQNNRDRP
jgi:hypothetical protein